MLNNISQQPWMSDDEFKDFKNTRFYFKKYCEIYRDHSLMKNFKRDKVISMIFFSNKLENTLPSDIKYEDAYKFLIDANIINDSSISPWRADGDGKPSKTQLVQHLKAYYYLESQKSLSIDVILKTHEILMKGSVLSDETPLPNGKIRTCAVNNGIENYMNFEIVKESLEALIAWYNKNYKKDSIYVASELLWRFLTIYPFQDGNGRAARLLFSYHLEQSGYPFPIVITSGKKRSRKHFYSAIKKKCYINPKNDLYTLMSYSVYLGWKNFLSLAVKYDYQ